jgi:heptaprenyl diphosphate synthase
MLDPAAFGLTLPDDRLPELLESALMDAGHCPDPWLASGLAPLLRRPAKRLRPALVLATAACGSGPDLTAAVSCAAAVELIHLSSLVHDDLMDDADTRCGIRTLHRDRGPEAAIVGGDFLFAAGLRHAAGVSAHCADVCLEAYVGMCVGQARETSNRFRPGTTMDEYLLAVNGKTAALMRAACRLGGLCAGLPSHQMDALARFGESLGMAFQLVDDLMDVVSTEALWSKPVESDMANGVYTVCVLAALSEASGGSDELERLLGPAMTVEQLTEAHAHARQQGVPTALRLIHRHVRTATTAMACLPASTARGQLAALPERYVSAILRHNADPTRLSAAPPRTARVAP